MISMKEILKLEAYLLCTGDMCGCHLPRSWAKRLGNLTMLLLNVYISILEQWVTAFRRRTAFGLVYTIRERF